MNDYCWVRLTEPGEQAVTSLEYRFLPAPVVDGWTRFQLWQAFAIFGPHLSRMGYAPFEENEIRFTDLPQRSTQSEIQMDSRIRRRRVMGGRRL